MTSPKLLPLYSHTSPLLWTSLKNGITCYKTDPLFFKMLMGIRKVKGISEQSGVFPFCFWVSQKCKTDENMVFKILFLFAYFMASLHGTARTVTRNRVRESGDDMQTSLWCSSLTKMKDMYSMFVLHLAYLRYQVGVMDLDPSSAKMKKGFVCACVQSELFPQSNVCFIPLHNHLATPFQEETRFKWLERSEQWVSFHSIYKNDFKV